MDARRILTLVIRVIACLQGANVLASSLSTCVFALQRGSAPGPSLSMILQAAGFSLLFQIIAVAAVALLAGPVARFALRGPSLSREADIGAVTSVGLGAFLFTLYAEPGILALLYQARGVHGLAAPYMASLYANSFQTLMYLAVSIVLVAFAQRIGAFVVPRGMPRARGPQQFFSGVDES